MPPALSLAPVIIAAVLAFSAWAKAREPRSTASTIRLLRLGPVPAELTARLLPALELVTALLLLTPWRTSYLLGSALGLALMGAFWLVIARAMTFTPRPTCGCFGRIGNHQVGARTLLRNSLLVALAGLAVWVGLVDGSALSLMRDYETGDWWWLGLAILLAAVAVLILSGSSGIRPARPSQPMPPRPQAPSHRGEVSPTAVGTAEPRPSDSDIVESGRAESGPSHEEGLEEYARSPIPRVFLVGEDHEVIGVQQLARTQAQIIIVANCWCGPTIESLQRLPGWREQLPILGVQMVLTPYPFDAPQVQGLRGVWWDPSAAVYEAFRGTGSPSAVVLGADGLLAGGPVTGVSDIESLIQEVVGQLTEGQQAQSLP